MYPYPSTEKRPPLGIGLRKFQLFFIYSFKFRSAFCLGQPSQPMLRTCFIMNFCCVLIVCELVIWHFYLKLILCRRLFCLGLGVAMAHFTSYGFRRVRCRRSLTWQRLRTFRAWLRVCVPPVVGHSSLKLTLNRYFWQLLYYDFAL